MKVESEGGVKCHKVLLKTKMGLHYTLLAKCRHFNLASGGIYSNHRGLTAQNFLSAMHPVVLCCLWKYSSQL
jgi:hypothetical protein